MTSVSSVITAAMEAFPGAMFVWVNKYRHVINQSQVFTEHLDEYLSDRQNRGVFKCVV